MDVIFVVKKLTSFASENMEINPMIMIKRPWPVRGIGFQICQKTKQSYMGLVGHTQRQQVPAQELMFDGIAPPSQQESRTSNLKGI